MKENQETEMQNVLILFFFSFFVLLGLDCCSSLRDRTGKREGVLTTRSKINEGTGAGLYLGAMREKDMDLIFTV